MMSPEDEVEEKPSGLENLKGWFRKPSPDAPPEAPHTQIDFNIRAPSAESPRPPEKTPIQAVRFVPEAAPAQSWQQAMIEVLQNEHRIFQQGEDNFADWNVLKRNIENREHLYRTTWALSHPEDPHGADAILREARFNRTKREYFNWLVGENSAWISSQMYTHSNIIEYPKFLGFLPFMHLLPEQAVGAIEGYYASKPARHAPDLIEILAHLAAHQHDEGTINVVIDQSSQAGWGKTGLTKSSCGLFVAGYLDGSEDGFRILDDIAYKKDYASVKRLVFDDDTRFAVHNLDEAEFHVDRRRPHDPNNLVPNWSTHIINELYANRSRQQTNILILPSLWILDDREIEDLCQVRMTVQDKGRVKIFRSTGDSSIDRKKNKFGEEVTETTYPIPPPDAVTIYKYGKAMVDRYGSLAQAIQVDPKFREYHSAVATRYTLNRKTVSSWRPN
jgi:hypothetical protein